LGWIRGCGLVTLSAQSEENTLSPAMAWVGCESGWLYSWRPSGAAAGVSLRLRRHLDGTNSGMIIARPASASTPSNSMASKPAP
jgi:hypothetical protein